MPKYRNALPQMSNKLFLSDGGLETSLIFHEGIDLPLFAAFPLLENAEGLDALRRYYARHARIAVEEDLGFVLESPTWRASADWGTRLGYGPVALAELNGKAIELMAQIRGEHETATSPMPISGDIGPHGDGYDPGTAMSAAEAEAFHRPQVEVFAAGEADFVTAMTMTNAAEATGVTRAAQAAGIPAAISFTVETDGRLPTGQPLGEAIAEVDGETGEGPAYYMINCAHPTHFEEVVTQGGGWLARIRGVRANASKRSHAELDNAPDLDAGDPQRLGEEYRILRLLMPHLTVLGGCCGTDHRHITAIGRSCGGERLVAAVA